MDHFPDAVGRIARLLYSRPDWDTVAGAPGIRGIQAARGRIKVGSFPSDDTHVMIVKLSSGQQLSLLVVPFDAESELAERVMAKAAGSRNVESASALLELSGPDQSGVGHAVWNDPSHPE